MTDSVTVEFGAKTDAIDRGSADVQDKLKRLQSQTDAMSASMQGFGSVVGDAFGQAESGFSGLNDQIKSINDSIAKGGATLDTSWMKLLLGAGIGTAVAVAVKAFHDLEEEFLKMERNAENAGISLQRFQEIQYAMSRSGAGTDKTVSDLNAISKSLLDLNYDVGTLGKFLDANNVKWKDTQGHVIDINAYIGQLAGLFQRAYVEGGAPLANKVAETVHVSQDFARTMAQGVVGLRMASDEAHKTGAVLSDEVVRRSADFEKEWNAASLRWSTYLKSLIVEILPYVENLIKSLNSGIDTVISKMGDWGKAWDSLHPKGDSIIDTVKKTGQAWLGALSGLEKYKTVWDTLHSGTDTFSERFDAAKGSLTSLTEKAKEMVTSTTSTDVQLKKVGEDMKVVADNSQKIKFPGTDKGKFDISGLRQLQEELDKVNEKYKQQKITEQTAVDVFRETEGQKVANLKKALDEREAATKDIFAKEIALAEDNAGRKAAIERQLSKDIAEIQTERLRLEQEQLKKSVAEWQSMLNAISGAFTSQLRGLLQGTTTWAQAIKNIATDLVVKMIEEFLKLAVIKPLSGMLASALEAPSEIFADIIKVIKNMFGPLLAGFTSFFAPTQGPAAPAEGAALASATVATAVGAVALATGTDYVPQTGLALLHQGEAIIPASQNIPPYGAGGGGGGLAVTFNMSAWDGPSVQNWLRSGGAATIARAVAKVMNNSPTLRPSY